ncbi:hypothetical protein CEK00_11465 [Stenotrophomonas maltophilia]|uniref:Transmembrane protein n=1 Tax=Stenotrophomonas maltophilia TaxID=40324 RepID=A0A270NH45_STEMA|nr:hypothetical protein CEK00_11465 [Stenotrophomonas maltophilia]
MEAEPAQVTGVAMVEVTAGVAMAGAVMAAVAPAPVMVMVMVMVMGTATGMVIAKTRMAVRGPDRARERARAVTEGRRDQRQGASTRSPARRFSR